MKIVLASKSPRRKELLAQIGIEYDCIVSEKEEIISSTIPKEVVISLSLQKAEDVYELLLEKKDYFIEDTIIIGADTVVACDDLIMGKPSDENNAKEMLSMLSGKQHSVWTGVTIISISGDNKTVETFAEETKVYMYNISEKEIREYVDSGESMDKAGAYAIQGISAKFIEKIDGDYNNVVGLPVARIYQKIKVQN